MKHDSFERNSALENRPKNPFVTRCNLIVLKIAIRKAESLILEQIGTVKLDNINTGLAYIRDAKTALIIALQDDCITQKTLFGVADALHNAYKNVPLPEILALWEQALDLVADFPIPYRVVEANGGAK